MAKMTVEKHVKIGHKNAQKTHKNGLSLWGHKSVTAYIGWFYGGFLMYP